MRNLILFLLLIFPVAAQSHSVTLNWTDTINPAGTTYNIYKATGLCTGSPSFVKIVTGIAPKTYLDSAVTSGNYCYYVTAVLNAIESTPSNTALAPVPPNPPTGLTVTVQ